MRQLFTLTVALILTAQLAFGQKDTVGSETNSQAPTTYTWQGACCDNNGKPLNPAFQTSYNVKKFHSKTAVEINIKSVKLGLQTVNLNIRYKDKIKDDTKIINLNDTVGIKLAIGKTVESGINKYLYNLSVYKKDKASDCWRPISTFNMFYNVYAQTISLNMYTVGDSFQLTEGWIKFD